MSSFTITTWQDSKEKNLPCLSITNYLNCPHSCSPFGNLVICFFFWKMLFLYWTWLLFMQAITYSGHLKIQPQNTNTKRILSYKYTVKRMNVVTDHFAWFWYLVPVLGKWRRNGNIFWVTIAKLYCNWYKSVVLFCSTKVQIM